MKWFEWIIALAANLAGYLFALYLNERNERRGIKPAGVGMMLTSGIPSVFLLFGVDLGVFYLLNKMGVISADLNGTLHGSGYEITVHSAGLLAGFLVLFFASVWATRYLTPR